MWSQANFNLVSVHPESVSLLTQVDIWGPPSPEIAAACQGMDTTWVEGLTTMPAGDMFEALTPGEPQVLWMSIYRDSTFRG